MGRITREEIITRSQGPGEWQAAANCIDSNPRIFFPWPVASHGNRKYNPADDVLAKSICAGCRVQDDCLEYALATKQADGVWGGTNPQERLKIHQRRQGL